MPFVLAGLALVHLIALHTDGSNNPLGVLRVRQWVAVNLVLGVLILLVTLLRWP